MFGTTADGTGVYISNVTHAGARKWSTLFKTTLDSLNTRAVTDIQPDGIGGYWFSGTIYAPSPSFVPKNGFTGRNNSRGYLTFTSDSMGSEHVVVVGADGDNAYFFGVNATSS